MGLIGAIRALCGGGPQRPQARAPEAATGAFLLPLATALWRLRSAVPAEGSGAVADPRRIARHVEAMWDALAQAGIEIQDHTGAPFDSGLALKCLAFQPTEGMEREKVIETVKPSIYYRGRLVQMGEVIVGTPRPPARPGGGT